MIEQQTQPPTPQQPLDAPDLIDDDELEQIFRTAVQEEIAAHLAEGHPIYYGGLGDESGMLFMRTPEGRIFEYRIGVDGTREIVREVSP